MIIRVRVVGSGTEADPYRVPLPNFRMLRSQTDQDPVPANPTAIVEVPAADVGALEPAELPTTANVAGIGEVITQLPPAARARMLERIKRRYRERAATYDLDVR